MCFKPHQHPGSKRVVHPERLCATAGGPSERRLLRDGNLRCLCIMRQLQPAGFPEEEITFSVWTLASSTAKSALHHVEGEMQNPTMWGYTLL
jgi:hypothetical protein